MNYFRNRNTGNLLTEDEVRESFPNLGFPPVFGAAECDIAKVDPVLESPAPSVGTNQRAVKLASAVLDGLGNWVFDWQVVDLTQEEIEQLNPVPSSVTRRQARQALMLNGLLELVPGKIDDIPNPVHREMARIEWEDSQVFERNRPLVIGIGTALGLDSTALDNLFRQAGKL